MHDKSNSSIAEERIMSNRPIRPPDRSEQEKLAVQKIESDKKSEDDQKYLASQHKEESALYATVVVALKKILHLFKRQRSEPKEEFLKEPLYQISKQIRDLFTILKDKDMSKNPEFAESLSTYWHQLIYHIEKIEEQKIPTVVHLGKVKDFVSLINDFPPKQDHSLGYYLSQYAGEKWLPFPFMDLLEKIHTGYLDNPSGSHLSTWLFLLDEIILSRNNEEDSSR